MTVTKDRSSIEGFALRIAHNSAGRISRRSMLGRIGKYALVLSGGGAVAALMATPADAALECDCRDSCTAECTGSKKCNCTACGHSVTCNALAGTTASCPGYTAECGSWSCGCSNCPSGRKIWTDCCPTGGECNSGANCSCVVDKDGVSRPTCCYKKCYPGGHGGCGHFIACRYGRCA